MPRAIRPSGQSGRGKSACQTRAPNLTVVTNRLGSRVSRRRTRPFRIRTVHARRFRKPVLSSYAGNVVSRRLGNVRTVAPCNARRRVHHSRHTIARHFVELNVSVPKLLPVIIDCRIKCIL